MKYKNQTQTQTKSSKNIFILITIVIVVIALLFGVFNNVQNVYAKDLIGTDPGNYIIKNDYVDIIKEQYPNLEEDDDITPADIKVIKEDPATPTLADKTFKLNMVEYNDIVIFYYTKTEDMRVVIPNISFYKKGNDLIFDGCWGVGAVNKGNSFSPNFEPVVKFKSENELKSLSNTSIFNLTMQYYSNICPPNFGQLTQNYFLPTIKQAIVTGIKCFDINAFMTKVCTQESLNKYFLKFDGVEMIQNNLEDINSFYTDLYSSVSEYDTNCLVDYTDLGVVIQEEQLYNCKTYFELKYTNKKTINAFSSIALKDNNWLQHFTVTNEHRTVATPQVVFSLGLNVKTNIIGSDKVTVTFNSHGVTNIIEWHFGDTLYTKLYKYLPLGSYDYTLLVNGLSYENDTGTFTIAKGEYNVNFGLHTANKLFTERVVRSSVTTSDINCGNIGFFLTNIGNTLNGNVSIIYTLNNSSEEFILSSQTPNASKVINDENIVNVLTITSFRINGVEYINQLNNTTFVLSYAQGEDAFGYYNYVVTYSF